MRDAINELIKEIEEMDEAQFLAFLEYVFRSEK